MKPFLPLVLLFAPIVLWAAPTDDERVQQALAHLAPVCLKAKKPADLDNILAQLSAQPPSEVPLLASRRQAAVSFVRKWRDYLEAASKKDVRRTCVILKSLCEDDSWVGLFPRSKVLDRYADASRTQWVYYETRTLADLPIAIKKLVDFDQRVGLWSDGKKLIKDLQSLDQYRGTLDQEDSATLVEACLPDQQDDSVAQQFKSLLLARVVSRYLDLPAEYRLKPTPTETAVPYLQRVIDLAGKRRDLVTLWRARGFSSKLIQGGEHSSQPLLPWQRVELEALDLCLTARKDEAEGRRLQALVGYLKVLQSSSGAAPVAVATAHIREIQNSKSADIDAAQEIRAREKYLATRHRDMSIGSTEPTPYSGQEGGQPWFKY